MDITTVYFARSNYTVILKRKTEVGGGYTNVNVPTAIETSYTKGYHGVDGIYQLTARDYIIEVHRKGQRISK